MMTAGVGVREDRDRELARDGWTRRFVGGPPRLQEMADLYRELGHDVLLDPMNPGELARECGKCTLALALFRVVYTRSAP
ncbi:MAG: hypothetical protein RQ745_10250 [Longimicrobiales bacterium]|nr:hypothetical protein [Longimicrobiales bacterium]